MRHAVRGKRLGRTTAHRQALFRNQLQSLVIRERIVTTLPKAKELRPIAERVITRGKHGTIHARRWALRWLSSRDLVKKVFDDIAPRFSERPGGYLRITKLGPRAGDGAEMAVIEFVEKGEAATASEPPKAKQAKKPAPPKKKAAAAGDEPKERAKKEPKAKPAARTKPEGSGGKKNAPRKMGAS
ncbi:MAG TPA: 50S ribosomal protein L17 [Thermoanaerobaculia bacterium]|nr:50S ribosomal protein L17 [Thermoanaerobaculia bacterium]